jgi:hypothetical protein
MHRLVHQKGGVFSSTVLFHFLPLILPQPKIQDFPYKIIVKLSLLYLYKYYNLLDNQTSCV